MWYYLFTVQSINMKVKKFSLAIITFLGILILSMIICTDYNDAYAQGGSSQSGTSSPWTTGAPLPTPRSEIAGAALMERSTLLEDLAKVVKVLQL
jgi:hypothetical protein